MSDYIVPPPGLVPDAPVPARPAESAEPERTVRAPDRLPSFRPTAPPRPPGPSATWRLRSDDGDVITIAARAVVGRDPRADEAAPGATSIAIRDPARSLSKTHALLEVVDDRLLVTDLASTNGVRIWPADEDPLELDPGRPTSVPAGAVLLLGDVAFLASRHPVDRAPERTV